jgi:SAM-dependent methyltransferase
MSDYRTQLAIAYDRLAAQRDEWPADQWKFAVADQFLASLPEQPGILDLGAGTGVFGAYLAAAGARVTAVDLSPAHIALCRAKGLEARVVDFTTDALGEGLYDGVWAMNVLLHVPKADLADVLEAIRRALVPDGLVAVCQWGGTDHEGFLEDDRYDPPRFFSLYSDEQFAAIDPAGMEKLDCWTLPEVGGNEQHHPQLTLLRKR